MASLPFSHLPVSHGAFNCPTQTEFKQGRPMERWGMDLKTKRPKTGALHYCHKHEGGIFIPQFTDADVEAEKD